MSDINAELARLVRTRAENLCEYCRMPDGYGALRHQIDHIRARKHDGKSEAHNLCLSCYVCNSYKRSDQSGYDPVTDELVPLFNPRLDVWSEHFRVAEALIEGTTAKGRATAHLLKMNDADTLALRVRLIRRALFRLESHP